MKEDEFREYQDLFLNKKINHININVEKNDMFFDIITDDNIELIYNNGIFLISKWNKEKNKKILERRI